MLQFIIQRLPHAYRQMKVLVLRQETQCKGQVRQFDIS